MLTTVFFMKEEPPYYRKAVVEAEEAEWFLSKGAKTAEELEATLAEAEAEAKEGKDE